MRVSHLIHFSSPNPTAFRAGKRRRGRYTASRCDPGKRSASSTGHDYARGVLPRLAPAPAASATSLETAPSVADRFQKETLSEAQANQESSSNPRSLGGPRCRALSAPRTAAALHTTGRSPQGRWRGRDGLWAPTFWVSVRSDWFVWAKLKIESL